MDQCVRVLLFLLIACVEGNESFTVSKSPTLITLQLNAHIGNVCNFELDLTTKTYLYLNSLLKNTKGIQFTQNWVF